MDTPLGSTRSLTHKQEIMTTPPVLLDHIHIYK